PAPLLKHTAHPSTTPGRATVTTQHNRPPPRHVLAHGGGRAAQPQTSWAVSTTSSSFFHCWSWVRALPSTVEEKPHCGERHSCSSGTNLPASSMRRFKSSLVSSSPVLVVTSPSTTCFPAGTNRSGSNPPERASSNSMKNPSTSRSLNSTSATNS